LRIEDHEKVIESAAFIDELPKNNVYVLRSAGCRCLLYVTNISGIDGLWNSHQQNQASRNRAKDAEFVVRRGSGHEMSSSATGRQRILSAVNHPVDTRSV
jgi:hypothetical protein